MRRDRHPSLCIFTPAYRPIDLFYRSRMSVSPTSGKRFMKRVDVAVDAEVAVNVETSSKTPVC